MQSHSDLVAQLVEHLPFKERVLGSSPSQVTIKRKTRPKGAGFLFPDMPSLLGHGREQKSQQPKVARVLHLEDGTAGSNERSELTPAKSHSKQ